MAPPLLNLQDIRLTFGGTPLIVSASLAVGAGEKLCLVGRNGSGKSTLLKIAAGLMEADGGVRFVQPGATVRYLAQEPDFGAHATTLAYVEAGLGPGDDPYRARYLLNELGLSGEEETSRLSGGEARRAALAKALAPEPDILLLDEPTNHLDLPAIEWLENELRGLRSALVLISHDRRFLENLSEATVWLDRGVTRRIDRGFEHFEAWRDETLEQEERERHKLDRRIAMEEDWMRYGVTARRKRNMRRVAQLDTMRTTLREERRAIGNVKLATSEADLSGALVFEAIKASKSFDGHPIVQDFSIRVRRGDRIGFIGPNGAGKTTLLNLLTGALAPDSGKVRVGANVQSVTLDQRRDSLDPATTVTEALTGGRGDSVTVGGQTKHVVGYMKDFLFTPEQARTPVGVLSGGERGRLALAVALAKPSNVLVLDEPTNDLDLETLDLLQDMLGDYPGTVLLVSHDRDFIDRVVTSTVVAEGDGRWVEYAGGYSDMVAQRGKGVEAASLAGTKPDKAPAQGSREKKGASESPAVPKRKLSFKDKHALESLPEKMAALERDIARLREALADPGLYARDPARFETISATLNKTEEALAQTEEQWLELEMLREEIEG